MVGGYKVITLCGSTKFKDEFIQEQKRLSLEGNIVISVGLFGHSGDIEVYSAGVKEMLDDMHKRKIDMADEIFVINKNGYIGSSTRSEIEYAIKTNKKVSYLEQPIEKEIWDAYFKDGTLANCDLVREEHIQDGLYHLVSDVLVRHVDGDYLLMRRDMRKATYPGYYEATAGGSALKGEDGLSCAKRELFEETGISAESFEEIGRYVSTETIFYSYLCVTNCDKQSIKLKEGETISFKWLSKNDFIAFINSNEMIDTQRIRYHDYFVKMGYISR